MVGIFFLISGTGTDSYMSQPRPYSVLIFIVVAVVSIITVLAAMDFARKYRVKQPQPSTEVTFPYRIVDSTGDSQKLYAYILHREDDGHDPFVTYSAVIRHIDPAKDNYKTYCKYVIHDIVKTAGTGKIYISLYDDDHAWELSEVKFKQQFKPLNKPEQDSVDKHAVATYNGGIYDDEHTHRLNFFPDAQNGFYSTEIFFP